MDLREILRENKPDVADSTIKTYYLTLKGLFDKAFSGEMSMAKFNDTETIDDFLTDKSPVSQRNYYNALFVLTKNPTYREKFTKASDIIRAETSKQVKTETQEENWIEPQEIISKMASLKKEVALLYKKETKTMDDLQYIQQYILLCLLGGQYIDTRRSKDFYDFKIKNIDKKKDNYLQKNVMHFNSYKTAGTYGLQKTDVPKPLMTILRKWIKANPTEYLLFDSKEQPLTAITLNQRFKKLFGRNASTNLLRHTHMSDKYSESQAEAKHTYDEIAKTMQKMGSSANMATTYIKH
jgi:hypothetical protein